MMKESSSKREVDRKSSSHQTSEPFPIEFTGLGVVIRYNTGAELLQQDSTADAVYLVRDGIVKLVWSDSRGKESIVGLRRRGWVLGAPSVITSSLYPASAITLSRSLIERIPADKFLDRLQSDPELGWRMHQIQSQELCEQFSWLGELACCSARIRLLNLLRRLIAAGDTEDGNSRRLRLPLKRKDIADMIAVTPEHLSRLLHELSREGHIDLRNGWIVVPERRALGMA